MEDLNRWGIAFLVADARVTERQRYYLVEEAAAMFFSGQEQRDVSFFTDGHAELSLEGRITTKGEYAVLGCFRGIKYTAELDLPTGKAKVKFLLSEQTGRMFAQRASQGEDYTN